MKYIIELLATIVFLLLCKSLIAQTSVVTVTYGKKFNDILIETDTISHPTVKTSVDDMNRRVLASIADCEYTLNISKNESIFKAVEKMDIADENSYKIALGTLKGKGIYYINLDKNITIEQKNLEGDLYNITENLSNFCWNLENETKRINEYTCYKATTTYQTQIAREMKNYLIEAWYVPEIPFKHGPVGFGNLPGLILELNFDRVCFFMKSLKLSPVNKIKIKRPEGGKVVTQLEFDEIEDKLAEEFLKRKW